MKIRKQLAEDVLKFLGRITPASWDDINDCDDTEQAIEEQSRLITELQKAIGY